MIDIDHQKVIGIAHQITEYTPPRPPDGYSPEERQAYYTGWHESTRHFQEQLNRNIQDAVGQPPNNDHYVTVQASGWGGWIIQEHRQGRGVREAHKTNWEEASALAARWAQEDQ